MIIISLNGCANRTAWYQSPQPYVAPVIFPVAKQQAKPIAQNFSSPPNPTAVQKVNQQVSSGFERLTYEDLMRFEPDCANRPEQIALIENQLKRSTFYRIGSVEGNASQYKISKSYYSLAKYRIWTLRLACPGGEVEPSVMREALQTLPASPPVSTRCYFEEVFDTKAGVTPVNLTNGQQNFKRREICTNYPIATDRPIITIGDAINLGFKDLAGNSGGLGLRKWRGNIYQVSTRTEIHQNQAVRFTIVSARSSNNQWVVVDKF